MYIEALKEYYRPLLQDCCPDCQVRFTKNPLRLLDCKEPQDQAKIAAAPRITDHLCEACRAHFAEVKRFLDLYQVPYTIDSLIVRGLELLLPRHRIRVYTGNYNVALNGGGRYDGLAELLGGQPTPAIGFGAGMERIILELKSQGIVLLLPNPALQVFVVYFGKTPEFKDAAVHITAQLRRGWYQSGDELW